MDHAIIIDALGGPDALAAALGRDRSSVYRWRTQGIPPLRWADVARVAAAAGVTGATVAALAECSTSAATETGNGFQPAAARSLSAVVVAVHTPDLTSGAG